MRSKFKQKFKRKIRNPFANRRNKKLIVHCCHHRVGTNWFGSVLRSVADYYGLRFQSCEQNDLEGIKDIFMQDHSIVNLSILPPHLGSHIIRDPRDVVISGHFFHLWTKEEWAHIPQKGLEDLTYQQYLNSLSQEEGIIVEMKRFASYDLNHMLEWNYNNPNFIEIRYEDIIKNEEQIFYDIFKHYGFSETAAKISVDITKKHSFEKKTKRKIGEVQKKSHLRSGKLGQWKEIFSGQHKEYCKELFGDALIKMGYEANKNW